MTNTTQVKAKSITNAIAGSLLSLVFLIGCRLPNELPIQFQEDFNTEKTSGITKILFTKSSRSGVFNPGFTNAKWWIKTEISNQSDIPEIKYIKLNNPHINLIDVYFKQSGQHLRMGDYLPFQKRSIQHSDFIIPVKIQPHQTEGILMGIDKKGEALSLKAELLNEKDVHDEIKHEMIVAGILIGWMFLITLVIFFAWIQNKEEAKIYYILYIVSITFWILSNWGIAFQLLWPNSPRFQNSARPAFILLANIFFLLSILKHFNDKKSFLLTKKLMQGCMYLSMLLFIGVLFVNIQEIYSGFKILFLNSMSVTLLISISLIMQFIYFNWKSGLKNSNFYLIGITFLILMSLSQLLYPLGINSEILSFLNTNGTSISLVGETSIIAASFVYTANKAKEKNENLEMRLLQQQVTISNEIINIQEKERNRIGNDLHDAIGGLLGSLNMQVNINELKHPSIEWDSFRIILLQCMNETKCIVDNLAPSHVEQLGFCTAFESYLDKLNKSCTTDIFFFHQLTSEINTSKQTIIFRILMELINNAIKHSNASEINISVTEVNKTITIHFDDNGIGYDLNEIKQGHGLKNIANRVQFLNGTIEINSNKKGTSNIIYIPLNETVC